MVYDPQEKMALARNQNGFNEIMSGIYDLSQLG